MAVENEQTVKVAATTINSVIADSVVAIPFTGNLVAAAKSRLLKEYVRSYPAIALTGKPASGKTTIADAVVIPRGSLEDEVKFEITGRFTAKKLANIIHDRDGEYLILDDFARFKSSDTTRQMNNVLDTVVRPSYGGDKAAQLILTAEPNVLENVTESLKTRLILIDVTGWKEQSGSKKLIEDIRNSRETISMLLKEFKEWIDISDDLMISKERNEFRSQYASADDRSTDNFFTLHVSLKLFIRFMEEHYKLQLNIHPFNENCKKLQFENQMCSLSYERLIYKLLIEVFSAESFQVLYMEPAERCVSYCNGSCHESCSGLFCDVHCWNYENPNGQCYYDPYDLRLQINNSLLIKNTKHLYGFNNYMSNGISILVVSANTILSLINDALDSYCGRYHVQYDTINSGKLSEVFGKLNLCLHQRNGSKRKYTIKGYPIFGEEDKGVYIFKLNDELFKLLDKKSKKMLITGHRGQEPTKEPRKLISVWESLSWRLGTNEIAEI